MGCDTNPLKAISIFKTDQNHWEPMNLNKYQYLTIIPQMHTGYEVIESQWGARCQVGIFTSYPTRHERNNCFY